MPVVYSQLQQTQIDESNYPQYGITKPNEADHSYFQVDFDPLKYCGGHRNMAKTDYLFVSTTGNLKDATFFGKVENYQYSFTGSGGGYASVNWIGSEEDITNFNVPHSRTVRGIPILPHFFGVGEGEKNPLRFFVERPKDEAKTATCFESVKKIFTGSGTKRRRKNKRKSSNKKSKTRKSKRRKTKKNRIRPVIYGGASIKQYGIATALRSLIFTYFPQRSFEKIDLSDPRSLDKYELTNRYTTVMDLLNQIVHNDDGRSTLPREEKFGDFLKYSSVLDNVLSDIISDIKNYLREQFRLNKINSNDNAIILNSITNIENEFPKEAKKAELPVSASASAAAVASSAQGVVPGRKRISVASIFSKVSPDDR